MTYVDQPLKKPSEPPKPILKPLPCGLEYTLLGDTKGITPYDNFSTKACTHHIEEDPGDIYILDVIV